MRSRTPEPPRVLFALTGSMEALGRGGRLAMRFLGALTAGCPGKKSTSAMQRMTLTAYSQPAYRKGAHVALTSQLRHCWRVHARGARSRRAEGHLEQRCRQRHGHRRSLPDTLFRQILKIPACLYPVYLELGNGSATQPRRGWCAGQQGFCVGELARLEQSPA
jgi:hypothetical protein